MSSADYNDAVANLEIEKGLLVARPQSTPASYFHKLLRLIYNDLEAHELIRLIQVVYNELKFSAGDMNYWKEVYTNSNLNNVQPHEIYSIYFNYINKELITRLCDV
ncbi:hypothetical protein BDA99DRAFT_541010 [Phascolomyces articulosus]|uniref:Uncharacterized protein n=1 Tax=Phascolomyces articulosus TaxID=60185 RepID=A0AAD5K5X1_9FUNG|nr:hypothetical protein BDA99DRAFT_541010 [Phascolomyces articulosus]